MPIEIDGQNFVLELSDIQGIEVIDLAAQPTIPPRNAASANILDEINGTAEKKMTHQDKEFFKKVFEEVRTEVQPKGADFVEPRQVIANNMDRQFPTQVKNLEI